MHNSKTTFVASGFQSPKRNELRKYNSNLPNNVSELYRGGIRTGAIAYIEIHRIVSPKGISIRKFVWTV